MIAVVVLGLVLTGPGVARADTVTDWNLTMVAGLEAAHVTPQPSSRIAAIVQASVFDALNGIERRYTPYHVDASAPRGASRNAAVASAAYTALGALIPSQKALFDQQLAATIQRTRASPSCADWLGGRPSRTTYSRGAQETGSTQFCRPTSSGRHPVSGSRRRRRSQRRRSLVSSRT